jgi:hypothetical protein
MDMGNLLASQFPQLAGRADELRSAGLVARMRTGGRIIYEDVGLTAVGPAVTWTSDTARGWAAMAIGYAPGLSLEQRVFRSLTFEELVDGKMQQPPLSG